jgi:hypothetical protein
MLLASLRLGFLLPTLVASLHVAAAPRFWTLTDVRFNEDRTFATGYFSYDDATQTISEWNVRVKDPFRVMYPAFTYVPGNSVTYTVQAPFAVPRTLAFSAAAAAAGLDLSVRLLLITPLAALEGSNATVSIITRAVDSAGLSFVSRENFEGTEDSRLITVGSLSLTPVPLPVVVVEVDEFYNPGLRHYFITASAAEKQDLDTGVHPGWVRTGESFKAFAPGSRADGTINPVCRYYSDPENPEWGGVDSHFLSAGAGECLSVFRKYASGFWMFESDNVFQINLPDTATGTCPGGTIPVYRLWNQRVDSNHRYTTRAAIKAEMLAAGYLAEGYGADGVVMCAAQ